MKVSFDFDSTLSKKHVQKFAKELIGKGIDVHIVTSRSSFEQLDEEGYNDDLYEIADNLQIKRENIHFTQGEDKFKFFMVNSDFLWHLDDDYYELKYISKYKRYYKTFPISVLSSNFKHKCCKLLNKACIV